MTRQLSNDAEEILGAHALPLGVRGAHVEQELVGGPGGRAGAARGARVDDGEVVVRLQVVAPHVLAVLLLVAAQRAHEAAAGGLHQLLPYVAVVRQEWLGA